MKRLIPLALTPLLLPLPALAGAKVGPVELTANVAMVSDYVWRGISQTDRNPAIQGGFDAAHDMGFYLGVWGSNVDFNDGDNASMELDLYGGWTKKWDNGFGVDVGMIHYDYPGANHALDYDFNEFYLGLSTSVLGINLAGKYFYSPDFFGANLDKSASYVDLKADYTFPAGITLTGHYGYSFGNAYQIPGGPDGYGDYSLTLGSELAGFAIEGGLFGTDGDGDSYVPLGSNLADDRFVVKVAKKF